VIPIDDCCRSTGKQRTHCENHKEHKYQYTMSAKCRWFIVRVKVAVHVLCAIQGYQHSYEWLRCDLDHQRSKQVPTGWWKVYYLVFHVHLLFSHSCIFTLPISYPLWTFTYVTTHRLRNIDPCHLSPRARESQGNGNGGSAAGTAAEERPFFPADHKCAILLNIWRTFKHIWPLPYGSLEDIELNPWPTNVLYIWNS
jgi:hypothetical protein